MKIEVVQQKALGYRQKKRLLLLENLTNLSYVDLRIKMVTY
jgi:hypothetical protein